MTILAIDQGTTSTRAVLYDPNGTVLGQAQQELSQIYPQPTWVEHDPEEIWQATVAVSQQAVLASGRNSTGVAAIGITNQRETTVVWDRSTGKPVYNAIVWQDRRTADICTALRADGLEPTVQSKAGLLLDPYFSATKIAWILDHVEGSRAKAEAGHLAFGTVDCFLLWRLTAAVCTRRTRPTPHVRPFLIYISKIGTTNSWKRSQSHERSYRQFTITQQISVHFCVPPPSRQGWDS